MLQGSNQQRKYPEWKVPIGSWVLLFFTVKVILAPLESSFVLARIKKEAK